MTRLAAWADRYLLPALIVLCLALDVGTGLNWTLSPASALTSPAYRVGQQITSMDTYGVLLLVLAALTAGTVVARGKTGLTAYLTGALLGGVWLFWTVLFLLAPQGVRGASYQGALFAAFTCSLHVLVGLVIIARPAPRS